MRPGNENLQRKIEDHNLKQMKLDQSLKKNKSDIRPQMSTYPVSQVIAEKHKPNCGVCSNLNVCGFFSDGDAQLPQSQNRGSSE